MKNLKVKVGAKKMNNLKAAELTKKQTQTTSGGYGAGYDATARAYGSMWGEVKGGIGSLAGWVVSAALP